MFHEQHTKPAYSHGVQFQLTSYKRHASLLCGLLSLLLSCPSAQGSSLFGAHSCQHWQGQGVVAKRTWARAFLAPLSLTLKGLQKRKDDPYNDDPQAQEAAVLSIDAFCQMHPRLGAPDAAGLYLKKLFEWPEQ